MRLTLHHGVIDVLHSDGIVQLQDKTDFHSGSSRENVPQRLPKTGQEY